MKHNKHKKHKRKYTKKHNKTRHRRHYKTRKSFFSNEIPKNKKQKIFVNQESISYGNIIDGMRIKLK